MVRCLAMITALFALPASAMVSITNLDDQTHQVVMAETRGSKVTRMVDPDETVRIPAARGQIFIQAKPEHVLMIDYLDRLVIWPEANLQVQMRRKANGSD